MNGAGLPVEPVQRVIGNRSEGCDSPGGGVLGSELADPGLPVVHRVGDLGEVTLPFPAACRYLLGPGAQGSGSGRADDAAETRVHYGGEVAGTGERPLAYGSPDDLVDVVSGRFSRVKNAPEPGGLRSVQLGRVVAGGKRGSDAAAVPIVT